MTYEYILTQEDDDVGILTLNRPEELNSAHFGMWVEARDAMQKWTDSEHIGCIVLTGAGPAWTMGSDPNQWNEYRDTADFIQNMKHRIHDVENFWTFVQRQKPIVAAINGLAMGNGVTHAACCDIRIASERARFVLTMVYGGATPDLMGCWQLPMIVGLGRAMELILLGKNISAREALEYGLVHRVVPHERLMEEAVSVAHEIAMNPKKVGLRVKALMYGHLVDHHLPSIVSRENNTLLEFLGSPELQEATRSFKVDDPKKFYEMVRTMYCDES